MLPTKQVTGTREGTTRFPRYDAAVFGLENYWYPVMLSLSLKTKPLALQLFGRDIMFMRNGNKIVALEDRCPHRGARLSLGWNLGDRVACWYHGVEVNGSGTVINVPAVPSCPLEGKTCVKSYPAQEHAGAVFLWFGDDAHKEPAPLLLPDELVGEE